jgi:hypothetical protein
MPCPNHYTELESAQRERYLEVDGAYVRLYHMSITSPQTPDPGMPRSQSDAKGSQDAPYCNSFASSFRAKNGHLIYPYLLSFCTGRLG